MEIIEQFPGMNYIVDRDSRFLACSQDTALWTGFSHPKKMIGISYDNLNCHAASQYEEFLMQDRNVLSNSSSIEIIAYCCYKNSEWKVLHGKKSPYADAGKLIGVVCSFQEIQYKPLLNQILYNVFQLDQHSTNESAFFYVLPTLHPLLSKRESECLYYLLRGYTAASIAKRIHISPKTVETYILYLKSKFNVHSRTELISSALAKGYYAMIPKTLLDSFHHLTTSGKS